MRLTRTLLTRAALGLAVAAFAGIAFLQEQGDRSLGTIANAAPVVAAQNSATDSAIQDTIQRSNSEQAQAISSNDSSVMSDTSTPDYLQQMKQINQDLRNNGVTAISLVNLQWGPVTVNGASATATTYETWQTTYSDGTTSLSRDQNDYTLVQQNGTWLISSDNQPSASSSQPRTSVPTTPSNPASPGNPSRTSGQNSTSQNWSGYAATGGDYTAVSGTWTVPQFSPSNSAGVDATWVGIGGVTSRDLIQAGTQETADGSGSIQYQAWIEMLPRASQPVQLSVHPGDSVSVSIDQRSGNTWQISFTNNTTGQTYQRTVQYASSNSSAEWVEEAPSAGRGGVLPLDNFGTISFSNGSTVKDGQTMSIQAAGGQPITLIGAGRQPLAVPSALGSDGSSFTVSRTQAASTPTTPQRGFGVAPVPFPAGL